MAQAAENENNMYNMSGIKVKFTLQTARKVLRRTGSIVLFFL
jgi:hypothetical protein